MSDPSQLKAALSAVRDDPDKLTEIILQQAATIASLQHENVKLREEIERLRSRNDDLDRQLQEAQRAVHRQAAPFRIADKKRKQKPAKPGRRKGHPGAFRSHPQQIDETVHVPLDDCPHCGGSLERVRTLEQFIEEIPLVRPHVTHLVTYRGHCARCGEVRSTHPIQVSTARAAAGTHLGPNALGVAMELTQQYGLTKRKTCRVLDRLFGLRLTPGGLVQAAHRMADKLETTYDALVHMVRHAPSSYTDETSWWVGGPKWWLWVFTNPSVTVYRVRPTRGRVVVHETLGETFPGVLVSDCLATYDDATPHQHKCYAHHLKAIGQAIKQHPKAGEGFLRNVRSLLKAAQALKAAKPTLSAADWRTMRRNLERSAQRLLTPKRADPLEQAIANRLRKQQDHLFTFLDHDHVDATNNLAERQLRPAVIARKVSCGNRTERGAHTWEILASVAATSTQCAESFRHIIANTARLPPATS